MKIATDIAVHLPQSWRLTDTADLVAWVARHACPKCIAAVNYELNIRDAHARRAAWKQQATP